MDDLKDKKLIEVEEKLKQDLEAIPLESFDELMAEIRPQLKRKRRKNRFFNSHTLVVRVATIVAASLIVLFGIGLTAYLLWPDGTPPGPQYRYEDADIDRVPCGKDDIFNHADLYIPNLDILINTIFEVGVHKESQEFVYFRIEGYYSDGSYIQHIILTIILEVKYEVKKELDYNTDNKITISGKAISILEEDFDAPFYNYKVGFKVNITRYYMDYQTTSETNDIESFMQLFLK